MRIGFVSASYAPEPTGIGPYSAELAEALAGKGHAVRVIAAFPYHPGWHARIPSGTLVYRTEEQQGVRVTRCRVYVPRNPRALRRLAHDLSWMLAATPVLARVARWADVWCVVTPLFGSAVLGASLARAFRARVHLHVQDVVPDVAIESGLLGQGLIGRLAWSVASWTYRSYPSVSVLSAAMGATLQRYRGGAAGCEVVAPNWVRQDSGVRAPLPERLRGCRYALYAGSFGRKQDLALVAEAAEILSRRGGPAVVVLGDGPGREVLERTGQRVVWLGVVDEATYRTVLDHALAGIVALGARMGDSVVPSKLAAYLGAGGASD